jgi:phosphomannomutase
MLFGVRKRCVQITGSHIPFDRNGIKFNKSGGEVLKSDEVHSCTVVNDDRYLTNVSCFEGGNFECSGFSSK